MEYLGTWIISLYKIFLNVKFDFDPFPDYAMNYATVMINIQMTLIISIHID